MTINLICPIKGKPIITQGFGENPGAYARFDQAGHNGVDYGIPLDTPVHASTDGQVIFIGADSAGYGAHIIVQHVTDEDTTFKTLYAHLLKALVSLGDHVEAGQEIGRSGSSGNSTGPHLHWELRLPVPQPGYPQGAIDPLPYLPKPQVTPSDSPVVPGSMVVVADVVNLRLVPKLGNTSLRGAVRKGDQLDPAGDTVQSDGITWQPIKAYIAMGYNGEIYLEKVKQP